MKTELRRELLLEHDNDDGCRQREQVNAVQQFDENNNDYYADIQMHCELTSNGFTIIKVKYRLEENQYEHKLPSFFALQLCQYRIDRFVEMRNYNKQFRNDYRSFEIGNSNSMVLI
jgi:hypothetical protein